jgi:hypothetical protein
MFMLFLCVLVCSCTNNDEEFNLVSDSNVYAFPDVEKKQIESNEIILEKTPDEKYIWQGDIILNNEQIEVLTKSVQTKSGIITDLAYKWPDNIIRYTFDANMTPATRNMVMDAINHWEANSSLHFLPQNVRTSINGSSSSPNYIEFFNGNGNWSNLGMIGGKQQISIATTAITGNAIHEIGHALGLIHEQCRKDRDDYINVNYSNIQTAYKSQFDKHPYNHNVSSTFDYNSIMMYPSLVGDFAINPSIPVMTRKDGSTWSAQRIALSPADIAAVASIYGYAPVQINAFPNSSAHGNITYNGQTSNRSNTYYLPGTQCTLAATPNQGYYFDGWYDGNNKVSSSSTYVFTVTNARDIEAKFKSNSGYYTITAVAVLSGVSITTPITITGAGTYPEGATCTVTISGVPSSCSVSWNSRNIYTSSRSGYLGTTYTFTVDRTMKLEATIISSRGSRP